MFSNMEAIMAEINDNPAEYGAIDVKFSTPSEYFDDVHAETPASTFSTFIGDFFPYRLYVLDFRCTSTAPCDELSVAWK